MHLNHELTSTGADLGADGAVDDAVVAGEGNVHDANGGEVAVSAEHDLWGRNVVKGRHSVAKYC